MSIKGVRGRVRRLGSNRAPELCLGAAPVPVEPELDDTHGHSRFREPRVDRECALCSGSRVRERLLRRNVARHRQQNVRVGQLRMGASVARIQRHGLAKVLEPFPEVTRRAPQHVVSPLHVQSDRRQDPSYRRRRKQGPRWDIKGLDELAGNLGVQGQEVVDRSDELPFPQLRTVAASQEFQPDDDGIGTTFEGAGQDCGHAHLTAGLPWRHAEPLVAGRLARGRLTDGGELRQLAAQ